MKKIMMILCLAPLVALAEGPILQCEVTREGPRSDGRPGYERIDSANINTVIDEKLEETRMQDLTVKTYINAKSEYVLVLIDELLEISSTQMGTLSNKDINLSLSGKGYSNYISCEVL